MTEPSSTPGQRVVAAAIVTSHLGVLVGRRRDGGPPWTFAAGKVEPRESPEDAAVREALEETGIRVRATGVIGSRVHPRTGIRVVYVAAVPTSELDVIGGESNELAEVRWMSLAEAVELMSDMFEAVCQHLRRVFG